MPYRLNPLTGQQDYYEEAWQIGMVYINLSGINPGEEIGYGEWSLIAEFIVQGWLYS